MLACLLAKREAPTHDGVKYSLPTLDILRPALRRLVADPQAEVFNHLVAPEVVGEAQDVRPFARAALDLSVDSVARASGRVGVDGEERRDGGN